MQFCQTQFRHGKFCRTTFSPHKSFAAENLADLKQKNVLIFWELCFYIGFGDEPNSILTKRSISEGRNCSGAKQSFGETSRGGTELSEISGHRVWGKVEVEETDSTSHPLPLLKCKV